MFRSPYAKQDDKELAFSKREKFRIQIRRRGIEQYQRKMRKQIFGNNLQQRQEDNQKKQIYQAQNINIQQIGCKRDNRDSKVEATQTKQNSQIDNWQQNYQKEQINANMRLEQIGAIDNEEICCINILAQLSAIIRDCHYEKIKFNLDRVLCKMSINQQYWSNKFMDQLFSLMQDMQIKGIPIQQHLVRLTECVLIEKKVKLYKWLIASNILNKAILKNEFDQKNNENSYQLVIKVIQNIIMQSPVINHFDPNLYSSQNQVNPKHYLKHLLQLLQIIIVKGIKLSASARISQSKINAWLTKYLLSILNLAQHLLFRLNYTETQAAIQSMKERKWNLVILAINLYYSLFDSKEANEQNSSANLKIRFKVMQITLIIIQLDYKQSMQGIKLQYLYALLPMVIKIIHNDLLNSKVCSNQAISYLQNPINTNNRNNIAYQTVLQTNYYKCMLKTLYAIMLVKDELDCFPAVDFIIQGHPGLLQSIYFFFLPRPKCHNNYRFLALMAIQLINILPDSHSQLWLCDFLQQYILSRQQNYDKFIFVQLLKTVSNFLMKHVSNEKTNSQRYLLAQRLKQNKVYAKLQKMLLQTDHKEKELTTNIENLMQILDQFTKNEQN